MSQNNTSTNGTDESPIPEVGTTWATPKGMDSCKVCACQGGLWLADGQACKCGAEYSGLSRTELVEAPERGEQDVLIRASRDDYEHKFFDDMEMDDDLPDPRRSLCYWSVHGEPQRTGPGRVIMFSDDGERVDAYAPICYVEDGRIWFNPLWLAPQDTAVPTEPPTRGFTYVDWGEFPW